MEFLVRLEDKVNVQVFCLNPVHEGNHMNRVFFEDDTFVAPCPDCGGSKWLYHKNNAITKKGHFITFKPDGWSWGENERKHYGILRVLDCTEEQAKIWCEGIEDEKAKAEIEKYTEDYDEERLILAMNQYNINYRPRKYSFNHESALTITELKNWNDKKEHSKVVEYEEITVEIA